MTKDRLATKGKPQEQLTRTIANVHAVIELMADHGVTVTPERLAVYLKFCHHPESDLARMMRVYVSNSGFMNEERCDALYERFFLRDEHSRSLLALSHEIQGLMGTVRQHQLHTDIQDRLLRLDSQLRQTIVAIENASVPRTMDLQALRRDLAIARTEAMTDSLSGLMNRKQFDRLIREGMARSMELGHPLSLLLLDVDHFKSVNDRFGHLVGDDVLRRLGEYIRLTVKGRDLPFRYGGEEFAVLLPETECEPAEIVADQIRKMVRQKFSRPMGDMAGPLDVTISIGVAEYQFGEPVDGLISRADQALYRAKRRGRNCVVSYREAELAHRLDVSTDPEESEARLAI